MAKVCGKCHWGYLTPSVSLRYWHQCPICSFTVLDLDLIHPQDRARAEADPLALTLQGQAHAQKPKLEFRR